MLAQRVARHILILGLILRATFASSIISLMYEEDELSNSTSTGSKTINYSGSAYLPTITPNDLDRCIKVLDAVSNEDGEIGQDAYLVFLEEYSSQSLVFDEFANLDLSLVVTFYTAACSWGRRCDVPDPSIDLEDLQANHNPLLTLFCTTVKDLAAVQVQIPFQYMIRYDSNSTDAQLVEDEAILDIDIKEDLEYATDLALLESFGCTEQPSLRRRITERDIIRELQLPLDDGEHRVKPKTNLRSQEDRTDTYSSARRIQRVEQSKCYYRVETTVSDMIPIECMSTTFQETSDESCGIVSSFVIVTATSLEEKTTQSELQTRVLDELKFLFTDNRLAPYLP